MRILILGCGWVGEEIAIHFKNKGAEVYTTCTSDEKRAYLQKLGFNSLSVDFDLNDSILGFPTEFDFVLNSIPASSRHTEDQVNKRFQHVKSYLSKIHFQKQIYLSSIGIYPDTDCWFNEDCAENMNARLWGAEQKMTSVNTTIYRLGGLFGKQRIFAKYFQHRICTTGDQLANFVHLQDVVNLIIKGFENAFQDAIYNIVAPEHPTKKEVILTSAAKYGLDLPADFKPHDSFQKVVDGSRISNELNYQFIYSSPLNF